MKNYQIYGFNYLTDSVTGKNVLTGNFDEADGDFDIPCFDGFSFFCANGKYYECHYPKINSLTESEKKDVLFYCGYKPQSGEYGVILGTFAKADEISEERFKELASKYQLRKKDYSKLSY